MAVNRYTAQCGRHVDGEALKCGKSEWKRGQSALHGDVHSLNFKDLVKITCLGGWEDNSLSESAGSASMGALISSGQEPCYKSSRAAHTSNPSPVEDME